VTTGKLITFDILPGDILLEIFDFYLGGNLYGSKWIKLAHVCRRWRSVVFQSPRRLNLRLVCTHNTPSRDILDIWPQLPLIIRDFNGYYQVELRRFNNIVAALEHNYRICEINLLIHTNSHFGYLTDLAAMQKPFPELTDLQLGMSDPMPIPDSFLGGTVPHLRSLVLSNAPFPGLPKLLLSATHLVKLELSSIPSSGYIRPEVMATSLSALSSLESLFLHFLYPRPRPALERRRPLTRSILPSLTKIRFHGASEYLEEILARIDAPRVDRLDITFFNQITFDTPQLFQFITRRPTLRTPENGYFSFDRWSATVKFQSQASDYDVLRVQIPCTVSEWQLSSLEQVCTSSLPPVSTLEDLYISEYPSCPPVRQDNDENTLWLELLHPFAAVENLYVGKQFVPRIACALQELGGITTEVLPALENIFLDEFQPSGPLHKGIEKFVAARQLTSHPVAVSRWDRKNDR
jgi:F-box-like